MDVDSDIDSKVQRAVSNSQRELMDKLEGLIQINLSFLRADLAKIKENFRKINLAKFKRTFYQMKAINSRRKAVRTSSNSILKFWGNFEMLNLTQRARHITESYCRTFLKV